MISTDQRVEQRSYQLPAQTAPMEVRQDIERKDLTRIVEPSKLVSTATPKTDYATVVLEHNNLLAGRERTRP